MLRNVNVWKIVSVLILFLTGPWKTASAQAPVAGIDANDTIVCVGNIISFTDISVPGGAAITNWAWTFGDGGSSTAQNPTYAYTVGGNYTVQLIVTDANGDKDTATQAIFVLLAQAINNTVRICSPQSATTIIAVDPNIPGVTGAWFTASSGVIASPGNDTTLVSNLISGTYLFFWVVTDGTCSDADQVTVIVDQPVTVNAGPDQQICSSPGTATMAASNPAPGTGLWTTTSSAVIANPSNRNTTVSGMTTAGTYTFVWTVTNGSCVTRDTMVITVSSPVVSNAGTDQSVCTTPGTANLSGSNPAPGTGAWSTTSSATITTPASASSGVTGLTSAGTFSFVWTVTNGACIRRDTMNIVVTAPVTANAGADVQVCTSVAQGTLTATNPAPGTGVWTALSSGTIVSPNNNSTLVTGLGAAGTYLFVWTVTNGPCVTRDTAAIVVSSPVTPNAGTDQQLCSVTTASLSGNNPAPGTGLWTTTGSAIITTPASATTTVSNLSVGNNTFIYTITLGACVNRDTVVIRVDSAIAANAGPDQSICETTTTITMAGNNPSPGTGVWTNLNGGVITTPTSATTTITGLTPGAHLFVWTITNGTCVRRDTMRVTVSVQIPSNAGIDVNICQGSTTSLSGNNPAPASGLWSTTSTATIATPTSPSTAVSGFTIAGVYPFVWTVTNGACVRRDTVRITVDSSIVATAGPDQSICTVSTATLAGNTPASGSGLWTTTGVAVITSPTVATSGVTGLAFGNNTFIWTITNGSCISRDTVVIRRDSVRTAAAGPDQSICSSTGTATMAANAAAPGSGLWTTTSSAVITAPTSPTSGITGLTTAGTYTFVWTITNGACVSRDTIVITVSAAVVANAGSDQTLCNVTSATLAGSNPAPGTGLWTSTSSAVITTPSSSSSTITGLQSGTYILVWTVTNGACISRDTVSVRVDSLITSAAGPDQQICTNTTVTMSANTPGTGSGLWTALNGGTITSPTSASTTITGLTSAGVFNFVWTITNGSCISRDTVRVTVAAPVVANAGTDQALCNVVSATLTGSNPAPGTGLWTTTSTASITTPSNASSGVTGLISGTYTFIWTITNGSCTTRDTVVVTVDSLITATAGPDQQICSGSVVSMLANTPGAGTGNWSALNGGTITNPVNPLTTITGLTNAGTYDFVWAITNGACVSRDTIRITVDSLVVADAGSDQQLCGVTTTNLAANPAAPGIGFWSTTSAAGINNLTDENTGVTGLSAGAFTFVWEITNGACISSDTIDVFVDSIEIASAGPDQAICAGSVLTMAATPATLGVGLWTAPDGGTIANPNDATTQVSDLTTAGIYSFIWTIVNGTCISTDTVLITVDSLVIADAGSDQQLCGTTSTVMTANAATPGSGLWTTASSANIANPANENTTVTDLFTGTYTLVWTITNGACVSVDSTDIFSDSLEVAQAGTDQIICSGSTFSLSANVPVLGIGLWTNPDGGTISNNNDPNATVTDLINAGTYTFIWTIVNGTCVSTDTMLVTVDSLVTASAGADQFLCENFSTILSGNVVSLGAGIWTTSGSAVIALDTDPNSSVSNLTYGPNEFVWTVTNGTCISSDTVNISVDSLIAAIAGADQQVCQGTTITLNGNLPSSGIGQWDAPDGGTIANINAATTTVTDLNNAGTYQFIWNIFNGACSTSDTLLVTVDSLDLALAGPDQTICESAGSTTMQANSPLFGTGTWTTASTAVIDDINSPITLISGLTIGTYDFVWTIVNDSCTSSDTITIVVSPLASVANAGIDQQACEGSGILLSGNVPSVGTGSWSSVGAAVVDTPGVQVTTVSGLITGVNTFVYTITSGACTSSDTMDVTVYPLPVADAGADQFVTSGTLVTLGGTPAATGGTGSYTYAWSPSAGISDTTLANPTITINNTSTFLLLVTDSLGCTALDSVTIWVNNPPDAQDDSAVTWEDTAVVVNILFNDSDPDNNLDTLSVTITSGPFNGTVVIGAGGTITYTPNPDFYGLDSLFYTVCDSGIPVYCDSAWVYFNINPVNDPPVALDDTATTVEDSCIQIAVLANDTDVENMIDVLTLAVLSGPSNGTITLDTLTGIITYCPDSNFVGTDTLVYMICDSGFPAPGLCDTALVIITVNSLNDAPVAINDTAFACSGDVVFIPALTNDFDPEGDTLTLSVVVQPLNGTVVITPAQEIVYSSNPGTSGWDSLQYVVCDQQTPSACDTAWVFVYVHPLAQITAVVTDVLCANDSTGAIDITINPPGTYVFTWTNGSSDEDIDSLIAGVYAVTVVDSNGCIVIYEDTIQSPGGPLSAFLAVQDIACFGDTTGSIDLQVSGGTAPYSFSWDTGSTDEDIDSLLAGTYSVLISDSNGCTLQTSATINAPSAPLDIVLTATDVLCGGDSTGAVLATVSGGTPGYTGVWSNGSTDTMIVLMPAGVYSYTVTDTNGCIATATDTILDVNPALIPSAVVVQPHCLSNTTGSISLSVSGGLTPYSYSWSSGDTTAVIDSILPGIYTATITDANGCSSDSTFLIADTSAIGFVVNGDSIICAGDTVVLQADVYNGVTYQWFENGIALPADTGSQLIVTTSGTYSLEAGSNCGVFNAGPVIITVNPLPTVDAGSDHAIECDSMLMLSATGATDYSWSPAALCLPPDVATTIVSPDVTTWFIVTGTDANGCSASDSVLVTVSCDTLFVPSGFSPNGDNINDYFVISQLDKYPNANLKIFNRWGALVYEKDKYDNTWNGLSNSELIRMGEELPDGTYYYVLDLKDGNDPVQGFVVLRR